MRYVLFAGHDFYPAGGYQDFYQCYDNQKDAMEEGERILKKGQFDWAHVMDTTDLSYTHLD